MAITSRADDRLAYYSRRRLYLRRILHERKKSADQRCGLTRESETAKARSDYLLISSTDYSRLPAANKDHFVEVSELCRHPFASNCSNVDEVDLFVELQLPRERPRTTTLPRRSAPAQSVRAKLPLTTSVLQCRASRAAAVRPRQVRFLGPARPPLILGILARRRNPPNRGRIAS